jgi:hypothetical protein
MRPGGSGARAKFSTTRRYWASVVVERWMRGIFCINPATSRVERKHIAAPCIDGEKYIILRFRHRGQHAANPGVVRLDECMVERVAVKLEHKMNHLELFRTNQLLAKPKAHVGNVSRDWIIRAQRKKAAQTLVLLD